MSTTPVILEVPVWLASMRHAIALAAELPGWIVAGWSDERMARWTARALRDLT